MLCAAWSWGCMERCSVCHTLSSSNFELLQHTESVTCFHNTGFLALPRKSSFGSNLSTNLMRPQTLIVHLHSVPNTAFLSISLSLSPNIIQFPFLDFMTLTADGPVKHMFRKTVDRAVGTGARAKLARAVTDNAIWMPVTTCLLFAALKLAQGQPEEIASGLQVRPLLPPLFFLLESILVRLCCP